MKLRNPFKKKKKKKGARGGGGQAPHDFGDNSQNQEHLGGGGGDQVAKSVLQMAMQVPENKVPKKKTRKKSKKGKPGAVPGDKLLKDKHVRSSEALGGGTLNDVHKVSYDRQIGNSGTNEGFWKAGNDKERSASMASSRLDQALGTNMLSNDIEAQHGGQMGITSGKVEGEAMKENKYKDVTDEVIGQYGSYDEAKELLNGMTTHVFHDDEQRISDYDGDDLLDVDLKHHETQRGLANLQLLDYLTAQRDRHEGNIFVEQATGKVSGIDNDMSFNELDDSKNYVKGGVGGDKTEGMPKQIDAEVGLKIMMMEDSDFLTILKGHKDDKAHLTDEQIEASLDRFHALKAHIDNLYMSLDDGLIYQWNDETYDEAIESGDGYLARAHEMRNGDDDD